MMKLFDYVNDISYNKKYLIEDDPENEKIYNAFIINRAFSMYTDTIFQANEANKLSNLDVKLQHDYLFNSIKKKKRWAKWPKKENNEDLTCVMEYYKYSIAKAKSVLSILTDDQLAIIKEKIKQGGVEKT